MIGMVMLVGLSAMNSISIVEFANQPRERGLGVREAVQQAARARRGRRPMRRLPALPGRRT
jgi:HAE1 family hydrophobic/amphiphilic exporter-1